MKDLSKLADKVIEDKLKAIDRFIEEYVEPLLDVGSPEKLINKPYEQWNDMDRQMLYSIYGDKLEDFIFRKEMKKIRELEKEVI